MDAQRFLQVYESGEAKNQTLAHFHQARHWGVRGFPSVIARNAAGYSLLASGYRPLEELRPQIDEWLAG